MSEPKYLCVKNWERYQERADQEKKNRTYHWIKFYVALPDDVDYINLSDAAKLAWPCLLLAAGMTRNRIPNDVSWIKRRFGLSNRVQIPIKELISVGFLIPLVADTPHNPAQTHTERIEEIRIEEIRIDISAEPERPSLAPKIDFDFSEAKFTGITEQDIIRWRSAYPAVDIDRNVLAAGQWLAANPAKRKKNYLRFLVNWFSRAQERGGDLPSVGKVTPTSSTPAPGSGKEAVEKFRRRMEGAAQ